MIEIRSYLQIIFIYGIFKANDVKTMSFALNCCKILGHEI